MECNGKVAFGGRDTALAETRFPNATDTRNAKLYYVQDQNNSLFNYDYGIKRLGALTPSKYLQQ